MRLEKMKAMGELHMKFAHCLLSLAGITFYETESVSMR